MGLAVSASMNLAQLAQHLQRLTRTGGVDRSAPRAAGGRQLRIRVQLTERPVTAQRQPDLAGQLHQGGVLADQQPALDQQS